ncbi:uncharacterized protein V2V93DRAFT_376830 [Kockiozyma suomiensis]|uniref:uncharacterized protein n=1 Tax=Kockiozyma suomiensis TaxID=1337062 RepID=UPI00334393E0
MAGAANAANAANVAIAAMMRTKLAADNPSLSTSTALDHANNDTGPPQKLSHITKGRAKGPKRRPPKAATMPLDAAASPSATTLTTTTPTLSHAASFPTDSITTRLSFFNSPDHKSKMPPVPAKPIFATIKPGMRKPSFFDQPVETDNDSDIEKAQHPSSVSSIRAKYLHRDQQAVEKTNITPPALIKKPLFPSKSYDGNDSTKSLSAQREETLVLSKKPLFADASAPVLSKKPSVSAERKVSTPVLSRKPLLSDNGSAPVLSKKPSVLAKKENDLPELRKKPLFSDNSAPGLDKKPSSTAKEDDKKISNTVSSRKLLFSDSDSTPVLSRQGSPESNEKSLFSDDSAPVLSKKPAISVKKDDKVISTPILSRKPLFSDHVSAPVLTKKPSLLAKEDDKEVLAPVLGKKLSPSSTSSAELDKKPLFSKDSPSSKKSAESPIIRRKPLFSVEKKEEHRSPTVIKKPVFPAEKRSFSPSATNKKDLVTETEAPLLSKKLLFTVNKEVQAPALTRKPLFSTEKYQENISSAVKKPALDNEKPFFSGKVYDDISKKSAIVPAPKHSDQVKHNISAKPSLTSKPLFDDLYDKPALSAKPTLAKPDIGAKPKVRAKPITSGRSTEEPDIMILFNKSGSSLEATDDEEPTLKKSVRDAAMNWGLQRSSVY